MGDEAISTPTGDIPIGGSAVGSAVISGSGNRVTIVYASEVPRNRKRVGTNPYRGLDAFDESSAHLFFGRERLVEALISRVCLLTSPTFSTGGTRLLAIMGPSGCGKSSVARAGLLPKLIAAESPWLRGARVAILRPGYSPIDALADALAGLAPNDPHRGERQRFASLLRDPGQSSLFDGLSRIVRTDLGIETPLFVLVDQFEETYNLCRSRDSKNAEQAKATKKERDAFVATLLQAAAEPCGPVSVLITLRSDFYGTLVEHPELSARVAASHEIVPAMSRDDLRLAVAEPARVADHPLDPATVERILDQAADEVTALPLVQFALERIWERIRDGTAPADTLTAIGGVGGALANRANEILTGLSDGSKRLAERAFLACVQLGDVAARDTRRRAWLDEVTPANVSTDETRMATEPFIKARLLATGSSENGRVWLELPHETPIQCWQTLRGWIESQRDDLRFRNRLHGAVEAWYLAKRPSGGLWRTPDLELLRRYAARDRQNLTMLQDEFLAASERQAAQERLFAWATVAAIIALAILATGIGIWAEQKRSEAAAERDRAETNQKIAITARNEALLSQSKSLADFSKQETEQGDAATGLLLALEAVRDETSVDEVVRDRPYWPAAEASLYAARHALRELVLFKGHGGAVLSVAAMPDAVRIITGSQDGTARIWDAHTGAELSMLDGRRGAIYSLAVTPDGSRIVAGMADGTAVLWDARTGAELAVLLGHSRSVRSVAITPDGTKIITGSADGTARLWDAGTGAMLVALGKAGEYKAVYGVALTPDGSRVVTASRDGVRVWDVGASTETLLLTSDAAFCVAVTPDGSRIVTGSWGAAAASRIWDASTGAELAILKGHSGTVNSVTVTPDGSRVITGSDDGTARVWDSHTGAALMVLKGHGAAVRSVSVTPDGAHVVTGSDDKTARLWEARFGAEMVVVRGNPGGIWGLAVTPDGDRIITGGDSTAQVRDARTGKILAVLQGHSGQIRSVAVTGNGERILTGSEDGTVRVWDTHNGTVQSVLKNNGGPIWSVAATGNGTHIAAGSDDGTVRVFDADTGTPLAILYGHKGPVNSVVFTPDGAQIISGGRDNTARIWDAHAGTELRVLKGHTSAIESVALIGDGARIVTGSFDNTARVWDIGTGAQIAVLRTQDGNDWTLEGIVWSVAAMPDGARIIAGVADGTARIWDIRTRTQLAVLGPHDGSVRSLLVTPDGKHVVTGSIGGTLRIWQILPEGQTLVSHAIGIAPRCLTPDQRQRFYLAPSPPRWCVTLGKWPYDIVSLGERYLAGRQFSKAIEAFTKAIDVKSGSKDQIKIKLASAYNGVAWELFLQGKSGEALPIVQKGIALDPQDPYILDTRGQILLTLGRIDEALIDLDRSIKSRARGLGPATYYARGRSYELKGNVGLATADYQNALNKEESTTDDFERSTVVKAKERLDALAGSPDER